MEKSKKLSKNEIKVLVDVIIERKDKEIKDNYREKYKNEIEEFNIIKNNIIERYLNLEKEYKLILEEYENKNILYLDLCPNIEYVTELCKKAKNVVILDHHMTSYKMYNENKKTLEQIKNLSVCIDLNKAGCQLAWDYFFPLIKSPLYVNYVADRDLWLFKIGRAHV